MHSRRYQQDHHSSLNYGDDSYGPRGEDFYDPSRGGVDGETSHSRSTHQRPGDSQSGRNSADQELDTGRQFYDQEPDMAPTYRRGGGSGGGGGHRRAPPARRPDRAGRDGPRNSYSEEPGYGDYGSVEPRGGGGRAPSRDYVRDSEDYEDEDGEGYYGSHERRGRRGGTNRARHEYRDHGADEEDEEVEPEREPRRRSSRRGGGKGGRRPPPSSAPRDSWEPSTDDFPRRHRAEGKAADDEGEEEPYGGGWEEDAPRRRGSDASVEAPARRREPAEEKSARDVQDAKAAGGSGGATRDHGPFVDFETAPPSGPGQEMVTCLVVRDRSGLKYMAPEYMLYLQDGRKRGHEKLILIARRQQNPSGGCSYHIYNVSRGHLGGRLKKKGGNYVGKLKASYSKSENVMYNNEERKEELGCVWFDKPKLLDHMRDGPQPRKLRIVVPPLDKKRAPTPHKVAPTDYPFGGLLGQLQSDNVDSDCFLLEGKEPVYENRHYRLNFHGRVTVPSVKNFQLVDPADIDEVICQFGKVDDDRFHLDFKGPLNAFQAFCVALSQFNY